MLSAYTIVGVLGLVLGVRYKIGAVAALAVAILGLGTLGLALAGWSLPAAFGSAFVGSTALQLGYLSGLAITCMASRGRYWPRAMRRYVRNYGPLLVNPRAGAR